MLHSPVASTSGRGLSATTRPPTTQQHLTVRNKRRRRRQTVLVASLLREEQLSTAHASLPQLTQALKSRQELFRLAEGTVAAATGVDSGLVTKAVSEVAKRDDGWLNPIVSTLDGVLHTLQDFLDGLHVPYSFGWSIILLTFGTKLLTFPFTKIQVEGALKQQKLKPAIEAIKQQYGEAKDKVQRETSALYEKAGVNPLAGCLPTLATIPIFWGLFRTLNNASTDGLLTEGFYWIPSLSGPNNLLPSGGMSWLYPFVDGHPPVGWETATRYCVIPVLLVGAQFISSAIISPPINPEDDSANFQKAMFAFLPFLIGWFALTVPSGLSLYYFANTLVTSGQQIWLRKLGGAQAFEFQEEVGLNQARRNGEVADLEALPGSGLLQALKELPSPEAAFPSPPAAATASDQALAAQGGNGAEANGSVLVLTEVERRCKRRKPPTEAERRVVMGELELSAS